MQVTVFQLLKIKSVIILLTSSKVENVEKGIVEIRISDIFLLFFSEYSNWLIIVQYLPWACTITLVYNFSEAS